MHPGKWQSYIFCPKLHNYIIAIRKQHAVWPSHLRWGMLFLGINSDRMTDTFQSITAVFFSLYKLTKTLPGTTLLMFGPVTLLCGTFFGWVKDLLSYRIANAIRSTHQLHTAGLSIHTGTVQQTSKTTSGGASETQWNLTPSHIWDFPTEEGVGNCCRIPALKRQCEWGSWLVLHQLTNE